MSIVFDSSVGDQAIEIPHASELDVNPFNTELTITCWFKCPVNTVGTLISKRGTGNEGYQVGVTTDGGVEKLFTLFGGAINFATSVAADDAAWHSAVFVNRDVAGVKRSYIYQDGVLVSSSVAGVASGNGGNSLDVLINARRNTSNSDFGFVGDFTISDARIIIGKAWTAEEIASFHARNGNDTFFDDLDGRWLLNEGHPTETVSGTDSVKDWTANGNHGTPNSTPDYEEDIVRLRRRRA